MHCLLIKTGGLEIPSHERPQGRLDSLFKFEASAFLYRRVQVPWPMIATVC